MSTMYRPGATHSSAHPRVVERELLRRAALPQQAGAG